MKLILIEGKTYQVIESLGYQIGVGLQARVVKTDQGERIAVKRKRGWTWWTVEDRLQPRGKLIGQGD